MRISLCVGLLLRHRKVMVTDWRDERIAEQDARIAQLKAELAERDRTIGKLTVRLAELEEQLKRSSKNSSKPPSSDPPWLLRGPKKPASGRKAGGQPVTRRMSARSCLLKG
jgi:uncharacterized coiled-coil protein SlyX